MITKTFTDVYGDTHTDAIVEVKHAQFDCSQNCNFNRVYNSDDFSDPTLNESNNMNNNINFTAVFWTSEEDKLANVPPKPMVVQTHRQRFKDDGSLENNQEKELDNYARFYVSSLPASYDSLSVEAKVEKFLTDEI